MIPCRFAIPSLVALCLRSLSHLMPPFRPYPVYGLWLLPYHVAPCLLILLKPTNDLSSANRTCDEQTKSKLFVEFVENFHIFTNYLKFRTRYPSQVHRMRTWWVPLTMGGLILFSTCKSSRASKCTISNALEKRNDEFIVSWFAQICLLRFLKAAMLILRKCLGGYKDPKR